MPARSKPHAGDAPAAARTGGSAAGGRLLTAGPAEGGDATAFLGRVTALDARALVRLRGGGGRVTGYVRLPFGVLVSRTVTGSVRPADVTVPAADLLGALEPVQGRAGETALPASRDVEWRAALPPLSGWQRLDEVPGEVVRSLVRAGAETLRAVPAGAAASAGESLLDHEALTVSGAGRTVAVPLRVLTALARMGFLGGSGPAGPGQAGSADVVAEAGGGGAGPGGSGGVAGAGSGIGPGPGGSAAVVGPAGGGGAGPGGSGGVADAGGGAGEGMGGSAAVVGPAGGGGAGSGGSGGVAGAGGGIGPGPGGSAAVVGPGGGGRSARGGGAGADVVVVSTAGGWVRLAAAYGSAYHRREPALGLSPR